MTHKLDAARQLVAQFEKAQGRRLDDAIELMAWLDAPEGIAATDYDAKVDRQHQAARTTKILDEFERQRGRPPKTTEEMAEWTAAWQTSPVPDLLDEGDGAQHVGDGGHDARTDTRPERRRA